MRLGGSFLRRTCARSGLLAPVAGMAGTVCGVRQAFHGLDGYTLATSSVVPGGIIAALVATLIGMLLIVPLAAVWEVLGRGPDDDDGAA